MGDRFAGDDPVVRGGYDVQICQIWLTARHCQPKMTAMDVATAARAASDVDPATGLRAVVALRRMTDDLERQQVLRAREAGWSWQQIGDALGISRQAVHKKHRR